MYKNHDEYSKMVTHLEYSFLKANKWPVLGSFNGGHTAELSHISHKFVVRVGTAAFELKKSIFLYFFFWGGGGVVLLLWYVDRCDLKSEGERHCYSCWDKHADVESGSRIGLRMACGRRAESHILQTHHLIFHLWDFNSGTFLRKTKHIFIEALCLKCFFGIVRGSLMCLCYNKEVSSSDTQILAGIVVFGTAVQSLESAGFQVHSYSRGLRNAIF